MDAVGTDTQSPAPTSAPPTPQRTEQIASAALGLFLDHGVDRTTLREIAGPSRPIKERPLPSCRGESRHPRPHRRPVHRGARRRRGSSCALETRRITECGPSPDPLQGRRSPYLHRRHRSNPRPRRRASSRTRPGPRPTRARTGRPDRTTPGTSRLGCSNRDHRKPGRLGHPTDRTAGRLDRPCRSQRPSARCGLAFEG
jgi:hypothetical protein